MSGTKQIQKIHPKSLPSEWNSYRAAKHRCSSPNASDWKYYGGRGIEFRFESFADFVSELGLKPSSDYTVDRINVNGHYEKGNVKWATRREQMNNIRGNHLITANGQTLTVSQWSRRTGIKLRNLRFRHNAGWCVECVLDINATTCVHGYDRMKKIRSSARNRKNNRFLTINGQTLPVTAWSEISKVKATTIFQRINIYGFCAPCAVFLPAGEKCAHRVSNN